ncbi:MAG: HAMP domain-containing sensor histidine kinase [Opitutaceae bacterium]|nr:HAMP domain-containing sensor histidine kinase [Opitutaceae bacterium]
MSIELRKAEFRVLVVAPVGADATNIGSVLSKAGIEASPCPNLSVAASEVPSGCGAVLLTEEALHHSRYDVLVKAFATQPNWSSIPVVLVVKGGKAATFQDVAVRELGERTILSFVEKPVRAATLVSSLKCALNSRSQQYEIRDLLRQREEWLTTLERKVEERTAKLAELNEELEAFSYSVSHDLRAPLRSMGNYARILYEDHAHTLSDSAKQLALRIVNNAEKMDRLMLDVLTLSRVGRSELVPMPVNLDELLDEIIDFYPDLAANRCHIHLERPLGTLVVDRSSLVQCFSNLLHNALKFVPKERLPRIVVKSEVLDRHIRVSIIDNGCGIDPAMHARIFGLFERAAPGPIPGTGVGLAIVKKAVERVGGTVGVNSTVGAGSCFWLELPKGCAVA